MEKKSKSIRIPVIDRHQATYIQDECIKVWEKRRIAQGYTKAEKGKALQTEFLLGVVAATDILTRADKTNSSSISPRLLFSIMQGDYIEADK